MIEVEDSHGNDWSDIDNKSSILDVLVSAIDFDLDAIILGYPRYAGHTERLHRHHWKVKNSSWPACDKKFGAYFSIEIAIDEA